MIHFGWIMAPVHPDPYTSGAMAWAEEVGKQPRPATDNTAVRLQRPPPGHPERLVQPAPLTRQEKALWGQLSDLTP
ncbi:DUF6059 family protein [Streptomyces sp. G5(2025)]|uniref:DUF6059 family protein n=1 Tax=Streptomyces sp. G5(2025) TaxID=3406628 RepID=UPI003C23C103